MEVKNPAEIELKEKVVHINRVAKVVKGGRRFSFNAIVVVGNGEGVIGYGLGKANQVPDAITKGIDNARKQLFKVQIINNTITHEVTGKYGTGRVFMKPASPGTGIIAGGPVRAVMELAGIQNVLTKSLGTANPHNVIRACMKALIKQHSPKHVSVIRNKKISEIIQKRA